MHDVVAEILNQSAWPWAVALGVLGATAGSFIAALVIRWPTGRSVLVGRSACDGCGRVLGPAELVPLLSALWLRGRCRSCRAPIDPRHWQIELAAVAIGVIAGVAVPGPAGAAAALFGWVLLALAALDVSEFWLPDALTATLALAGVVVGVLGVTPPLVDRIVGGAAGFAALWLIAAGYRLVRGREGLGGGDPKLFGAIGLWLGWRMLPVVLVLACLTGIAVVLARLLAGRAVRGDDRLPLGALLAIAAYPVELVVLAFHP
ncbi:MAG TPA: A24 family peptidase [Sphingomonas sp.]|nr:A24 family peptidase [Sphingomonas sp.]